MKLKYISIFILLSLFSLTNVATAANNQPPKMVILSIGGMMIPVPLSQTDRIAPVRPALVGTPDATTYADSVEITISGEVGATVYVNAVEVGVIGSSGSIVVALDTSGADGQKDFLITLRDSAGNSSSALVVSITKVPDPKYSISYKGLTFYHQNKSLEGYALSTLTDSMFNTLTETEKLKVANKLLSTLFFSYPQDVLLEKIGSGRFISDLFDGMQADITDKAWLESYIIDSSFFHRSNYNEQEGVDILTRFYAMQDLDRYFLHNWMAYVLTQTIMFSPAYELDTAHPSNIESVYSRIVSMLNVESGMRYIGYVHMMSEDNWRRFRSPEDNGREMLELFALDENDAHVPIAGQALQNWRLDSDSDTLVVGLNQNTVPLSLFGTTIVNGDDFYRELVKSSLYANAITTRLVDFFFPKDTSSKKAQIVNIILASNPNTWQDIMLQIVFSSDYLLYSEREKSGEELFFSLAKKMNFKHRTYTLHEFKNSLEDMNQASMEYKLGKLTQVPLDTLSFAYYHKRMREYFFLRRSNPLNVDNYTAGDRQGWSDSFIANEMFNVNESSITQTLESLVTYLFNTVISRNPTADELALFKNHTTYISNSGLRFDGPFNMLITNSNSDVQIKNRENFKRNITYIVLDYLSRLTETYTQAKVR